MTGEMPGVWGSAPGRGPANAKPGQEVLPEAGGAPRGRRCSLLQPQEAGVGGSEEAEPRPGAGRVTAFSPSLVPRGTKTPDTWEERLWAVQLHMPSSLNTH